MTTEARTSSDPQTHGRLRDGYQDAREAASRVYENAREKAKGALDTSRDAAADAARRTTAGIESNPLGILVGGLAVGALAGALIPRSDRERQLLAPLGQKLGDTARNAAAAAKEAGRSELEARGLTPTAGKDQAKSLLEGVMKALTSAGTAAAGSASSKQG